MAWSLVVTLMALVIAAPVVSGSKILVFPFHHCLNSHLLNAERLSEILAHSGHQVDMLVSSAYFGFDHLFYASGQRDSSFRLVQFSGPENYTTVCEHDTLDFMLYASIKDRFASLFDTFLKFCDKLFLDELTTMTLQKSNYDLVIVEALDPCGRILVDYLNIPFIVLVSAGLGHFDGNPRPPSYLPAATAPFTTHMNFGQRLANTLMKLMYENVIPALLDPLQPFEDLKTKYNINTSLALVNSFENAAVRLVNSDFSIDYPAPIEPDTVLVGGFAVEKPSPLSQDLEDFMSGSGEHGVIIMNFGTIVKSFSQDWTAFFADVFARLPQRVLWRHSHSNVTLSPNVKLVRWMPQSSLLAHPKTRLFLSHCGLNSLFEAASFGVPVVALPLSGDQFNQAAKVSEHLEMGVIVDVYTMTQQSLYDAIQEVLTVQKYGRNAKEVAQRIADQPITAAEKIKFWIEYVIRHKGAAHLRSDASRLTWYQYFCLDVVMCLAVGLVLAAFLCSVSIYLIGRLARRMIRTFINCVGLMLVKLKKQ